MANKNFSGNSYQRRKLRRWLDRNALPLIDAGKGMIDVAKELNVDYYAMETYLRNAGYRRAYDTYKLQEAA